MSCLSVCANDVRCVQPRSQEERIRGNNGQLDCAFYLREVRSPFLIAVYNLDGLVSVVLTLQVSAATACGITEQTCSTRRCYELEKCLTEGFVKVMCVF